MMTSVCSNKNNASNSFTGSTLHINLGPPERQINMKLSTKLARLLGLLTAFPNVNFINN